MPLIDVLLDAVAGEPKVPFVDVEVRVVVNVNGSVMVTPVAKGPVVRGAVGAVFSGAVSLQGVGKAGEDDPVTGLPSVEDSGTGK